MSWWTDATHAFREIGDWWEDEVKKTFNDALKDADQWMRENNMPNVYVGYTYNGEGLKPNISATPYYGSNPNTIPKVPAAYSRTSARTATDIAQGGMTKQEIQEFNMKHPNETVMRGQ